MLAWLRDSGKLCERRARLFCVAACRRHWHLLKEGPGCGSVEMAERFAAAGYVAKEAPRRGKGGVSREAPGLLPLPTGEAARQARAYLAKVPPAVEGRGGDRQTFTAACVLVLDFGLPPEDALPLLLEYN